MPEKNSTTAALTTHPKITVCFLTAIKLKGSESLPTVPCPCFLHSYPWSQVWASNNLLQTNNSKWTEWVATSFRTRRRLFWQKAVNRAGPEQKQSSGLPTHCNLRSTPKPNLSQNISPISLLRWGPPFPIWLKILVTRFTASAVRLGNHFDDGIKYPCS